jgi:hypothetical protein
MGRYALLEGMGQRNMSVSSQIGKSIAHKLLAMRGRCVVFGGLQTVCRAVINPLLCVYKHLVVWPQTACTTFVAMLLFVL